MWPTEDISARLASPDFPSMLLRDPDLTRITRRSGGTIAPDGGPLTMAGYRRIRQWRHDWLALPAQTIPAVIGSDGVLRSGADGLHYLADLAERTGAGNQADRAGTAAGGAGGTAARPGGVRPAARRPEPGGGSRHGFLAAPGRMAERVAGVVAAAYMQAFGRQLSPHLRWCRYLSGWRCTC